MFFHKYFKMTRHKILANIIRNSSTTIFSLSSGKPKCGVAVIRVSGNQAGNALKILTRCDKIPKARFAALRSLSDPVSNELIDKGIVLWFPGPKSFTGEDSCEFQVHGGTAIISAMLNALGKIEGLRPAEPGEFTKRAFFSGKLDLTEVEGLADLIHAETEKQRKQALLQANGHLSQLYQHWKEILLKCIAHLEAWIDFSEDENIEDHVLDSVIKRLQNLDLEIDSHLKDGRKGELLRDGVRAVILGATNVGKSSFMNKLSQKEISIVTNIAGTTRDVIESSFDIGGFPVIMADTAGLRQSSDVIENEGMTRARKYASLSDLVLIMIDALHLQEYYQESEINVSDYLENFYFHRLGLEENFLADKKVLTIVNKIDLLDERSRNHLKRQKTISISCTEDSGIEEAIKAISIVLEELCGNPSAESPCISQSRHRYHLINCSKSIKLFLGNFNENSDMAILVQNLRNAIRSLGHITGEVRTDDILDVIFRDFCIGK